jgi:hypothetical protein
MKEKITMDDLMYWDSWVAGAAWFRTHFPNGATLDELEAALRERGGGRLFCLALTLPPGIAGDSLERRLSWCPGVDDRIYVLEHWIGKIPEK